MMEAKIQNQKIIKYIEGKLKEGEMILSMDPVIVHGKNPTQHTLVITSSTLYFLYDTSIKKYFKAEVIDSVAMTPFSNEIVIQYRSADSRLDFLRFESQTNVKIIKNIIYVRERFCQLGKKLTVVLEPVKTLEKLATKDGGTSKIIDFFFRRKQAASEESRLSGDQKIIEVSSKDFALQIGQKMYSLVYENTKLLYINSNHNFRFLEEEYNAEVINPHMKIYRSRKNDLPVKSTEGSLKKIEAKDRAAILMKKISKGNKEEDQEVRKVISTYKNADYKEELLYGIETQTHFQVITAVRAQERNCQQILEDNEVLCERDLKSIFFRLLEMIENSEYIFCSICPQNITLTPEGVKISQIFSCLSRRTEIDYLSPEEFYLNCTLPKKSRLKNDRANVELINLWKAGILMYELAFGNVPFPVESVIKSQLNPSTSPLTLNYPLLPVRTNEFRSFISCILQMDPQKRGLRGQNYENKPLKDKLLKLEWLRHSK